MLSKRSFRLIWTHPASCEGKRSKEVKLNKSVYGLKQAGRRWTMCLGEVLVIKVGMEQCKADPSVFRLIRDDVVVMTVCIHVHVDDITVARVPEASDLLNKCLLEEFQTMGRER